MWDPYVGKSTLQDSQPETDPTYIKGCNVGIKGQLLNQTNADLLFKVVIYVCSLM